MLYFSLRVSLPTPEIHNDPHLKDNLQNLNHETEIIEATMESKGNDWRKQNIFCCEPFSCHDYV